MPANDINTCRQERNCTLIVAAALLVLWLIPAEGRAFWGSCSGIVPSGAVPAGYGAPYDVVGGTGALLISGKCKLNEPRVKVSVGDGRATTYVYQDSYFWDGASWVKVALGGAKRVGPWIKGRASAVLGGVPAEVWYAAYVCQWDGAAWQCGCRTSGCTQRFWQIQKFTRPVVASVPEAAGGFQPFPVGARLSVSFDAPLNALGITAGTFLAQLNASLDESDRYSLCDLKVLGLVDTCAGSDVPFAAAATLRALGFSSEAFAADLAAENKNGRLEISYFDPQQQVTYLLAVTTKERASNTVLWEILPIITDASFEGKSPERLPSSYVPPQVYSFGIAYLQVFLREHFKDLQKLPQGAKTDLPFSYGF